VPAIRGDVQGTGSAEDTGNGDLTGRVLVPVEHTLPEPSRSTRFHQGRGQMLDHLLITREPAGPLPRLGLHNERLLDESAAFVADRKFPESGPAPVVAPFCVDN
jgi:hypothetical protein